MKTEQRSILGTMQATDGNRLVGYAAVFDSPTTITEQGRTFTEVIRHGAFKRAVNAAGADIIATFNHDPSRVLGRTSAGTLQLSEDGRGLRFEVQLPDHAADVREMVARGDVRGASFTFSPRPNGEKWTGTTRELTDLYVVELGPVTMPAYRDTSVGLRSAQWYGLKLRLLERA